jgi:hypothetical protein
VDERTTLLSRLTLGLAYSTLATAFVSLVAAGYVLASGGNSTMLLLWSMAVSIVSIISFLFYVHITGRRPPET